MNKCISIIISIITIALIVLSSCEDHLKSTDLKTDYFPLQIGNYWETVDGSTKTIDQIVTLDEKEYFRMVNYFQLLKRMDTIYYRKTSEGKVYSRTLSGTESLTFDLGAELQKPWQAGTMFITNTKKNAEVILGTDTLKNCYAFYFDPNPRGADDEYIIYLAPGIGYVNEFWTGLWITDDFKLKKVRIDGVDRSF